jgi:hypothetical protein
MNRVLKLLAPVLLLGIVAAGAYYFWNRRVQQKEAQLPAPRQGPGAAPTDAETEREQKARLEQTLRTMEETRRLNEQARPGSTPPGANPNADVQRTFKTIEEINRLNRLNRENRSRQPANRP